MGLFNAKKVRKGIAGTTRYFNLGAPEAEADRRNTSPTSLTYTYEDFHSIDREVEQQNKFLILGRKGVGKTAYVTHLELLARNNDEAWIWIGTEKDIKLERVIQSIGTEEQIEQYVFEWIILIRFIQLIIDSNRGYASPEIASLIKFMELNSGFCDIDSLSKISQEKTKGGNTGFSLNLLSLGLSKQEIAQYEKAPFYAFVPKLRDLVCKVLRFDDLNNCDFVLMFDDLDANFKISNERQRTALMNLIRISRDYNTNYLAGTKSRILIFLRDDIASRLSTSAGDSAKIFNTYSIKLNWYSPADERQAETEILLRKFINLRIAANFEDFGITDYNHKDPWCTLVKNESTNYKKGKTAFKYLLDYTFYRPRDLLYIFSTLGTHSFAYPLNKSNLEELLKEYAEVFFEESTNELNIIFDANEQAYIRLFLNAVGREQNEVSFERLDELSKIFHLSKENVETLIEYSLIVPRDKSDKMYFKYREQTPLSDLKDYSFGLPKGIL